ncbi:putative palmitoyltransferase ZDHHC7 [Cryptosporidium serpentis]
MCSICHLICVFTDPGVLPTNKDLGQIVLPIELENQIDIIRSCIKCNNYKPPRVHHCSVCKRCIFKMDHHCPWINNCVGYNNQKHFLLFLFYVFCLCIYSVLLVCYRFYNCIISSESLTLDRTNFYHNNEIFSKDTVMIPNWYELHSQSSICLITPIILIFGFSVVIKGLVFGLFSFAMFIDQILCIIYNTTGIEHLKQDYTHKKQNFYNSFIEVCGQQFTWKWFIPTKTRAQFRNVGFDTATFVDLQLNNSCNSTNNILNNYTKEQRVGTFIRNSSPRTIHCCKLLSGIDFTRATIASIEADFSFHTDFCEEGSSYISKTSNCTKDKSHVIYLHDLSKQ